jgi:DNA topoisomerase-3
VHPTALTDTEKAVFDLVARRFIANFYPECKIATTTVLGEVDKVEFKVNGKQILDMGWRVVFNKPQDKDLDETEERTLPIFNKGEGGPHEPTLAEKWTSPPKPYTEATLLRAMETAGKLVENDELRDALKENGIGRPSTRASIIETLFKRDYIRKERKNLIATNTGVDLILTIQEDLLKSAELTGMWEKKLRQIDKGDYQAKDFLDELKAMVTQVVYNVKADNRTLTEIQAKSKQLEGTPCPLCGKGTLLKGNTAYGCSEWRNGCTYRVGF